MTLKKLPKHYPDKQLYRLIKIVYLNDPFNTKYAPYEISMKKFFEFHFDFS